MSTDDGDDGADQPDLPSAEDAVTTGAAADSAEWDERLKGLPRLLRYAMLIVDKADHVEERLIAEVDEVCSKLPHNFAWAAGRSLEAALALAAELDRRAVAQNEPTLRSLADSIRLVSLPTPRNNQHFEAHRRVGKSLVHALHISVRHADEQLCCDLERFTSAGVLRSGSGCARRHVRIWRLYSDANNGGYRNEVDRMLSARRA